MPSSSTSISRRMGVAIATAVAGVVLAIGVSIATLGGWVRPAQAVNETAQMSLPGQASLPAMNSTTPQVVLVPVAPAATSAQPPATGASLAGAETSIGPSSAAGAFLASGHTERGRSLGARVPHRERDDD